MNSFIENADPFLQYTVSIVLQNTFDKIHGHHYPQEQDSNSNHNHRTRLNISLERGIDDIEGFWLVELNFTYLLTIRTIVINGF